MKATNSLLKIITVFFSLFAIVLIVNFSILTFDMMYPEQPTIYLANQTIHSVWDLIKIYLHPQQLHSNIPFFRPSGHFLIYQILAPFIGWHNTKAFMLVSMLFLTLTGYFLIRLYTLLFPRFQMGGWIAFALFMMHPALSISKLTIMHFEYAYVFFLVLSLYLFVQYTQQYKETHIHNKTLFLSSLFTFVVAVTFKEPAIMLGPVMATYYLIEMYESGSYVKYVYHSLLNRISQLVIIILAFTSILLACYILASWPSLSYGRKGINLNHTIGTLNAFLVDGIGLTHNYITSGSLPFPDLAWRKIVFSTAARLLFWSCLWIALFASLRVFIQGKGVETQYKKSLLFLYISILMFMILPLSWAMGMPWHYSLSLLFLSVVMGFSVEYLTKKIFKDVGIHVLICAGLPLVIAGIAMSVNTDNIDKYQKMPNGRLALAFNRNAVLNPPPELKSQLNKDSVLVVEDSILQNDYMMGNAAFPFLISLNPGDYAPLEEKQRAFYMKFDHTYSGTLFRYAYLLPTLKEEVYPFKIENMIDVPNEIIYDWLLHGDNIFSVGYDANGYWYNKTALFKRNLAQVQSKRHLKIYSYVEVRASKTENTIAYSTTLTYPDEQLCRYSCDQDKLCKAYRYEKLSCDFYYKMTVTSRIACHHCVAFNVKKDSYL